MSKDKKKKKDGKKKGAGASALAVPTKVSKKVAKAVAAPKVSKKIGKGLKSASQNPLVADVIAAALVATAAALKDSNKARELAAHGADELEQLAKASGDRGNALWLLALDVGRRALDELANGKKAPKKSGAK